MGNESLKSGGFWGAVAVGLILLFVFFFALIGSLSRSATMIGGGFGGGWRNGAVLFVVVVGVALGGLFMVVSLGRK